MNFFHKIFLSLSVIFCFASLGSCAGTKVKVSEQYYESKSATDNFINPLQAEFRQFLEKTGAKNISFSNSPDKPGIWLSIQNLSPSLKKEGFVINSSHNGRLHISANHENGLKNGVYYYLGKLGFRFFLPGDIWTHIPQLHSVYIDLDETKYPLFENRSVFGTGGFPYHPILDKEQSVQKLWERWLERNRWSSEEYIGGHIGEIFNNTHKETLVKNPQFLALHNGKREWRSNAKWCISNPELVKLFVKDRLAAFAAQKQRSPDRNLISVDPADGGGHCQCDACAKMGSVSDRVFYLANQTAIAIRKQWPGGGVSLYAYNEHAAPPHKDVEENVYVAVIPNAYQNVAVPEILLYEWKNKAKQMGTYDYWNLTDGSKDLPSFNYHVYLTQRLALWKRLGLKGYALESGYSKFAAGIPLYLLSRMVWDEQLDVTNLMEEFTSMNFGSAHSIIAVMLKRWAENFDAKREFQVALQEIKQARKLENNPQVNLRLDELEHYIYYTALFTDAEDNFKTSQVTAKAENVMKYMWTIYDEALINTSRIHQYFILRPIRDNNMKLVEKWSLTNTGKQKEFWQQLSKSNQKAVQNEMHKKISFANQPTLTSFSPPSENLHDSIFRQHGIHFKEEELHLKIGKSVYFSFNSGNESDFYLDILLPESAPGIPGIALYDINKNFLDYQVLKNTPGKYQRIVFKNLNKNTRYRIFASFRGLLWDLKIANKSVVIDASNVNNSFASVQTGQQANLLLNAERTTEIPLKTDLFKGTVSDTNGKIIFDMKATPQKKLLTIPPSVYIKVKQAGTNTIELELEGLPAYYFFK